MVKRQIWALAIQYAYAYAETYAAEHGEPVFRPIDKGQRIEAGRPSDRSVARIVKDRIRASALASGKSDAEADAMGERMSGHSLRAGYATPRQRTCRAIASSSTPGTSGPKW